MTNVFYDRKDSVCLLFIFCSPKNWCCCFFFELVPFCDGINHKIWYFFKSVYGFFFLSKSIKFLSEYRMLEVMTLSSASMRSMIKCVVSASKRVSVRACVRLHSYLSIKLELNAWSCPVCVFYCLWPVKMSERLHIKVQLEWPRVIS